MINREEIKVIFGVLGVLSVIILSAALFGHDIYKEGNTGLFVFYLFFFWMVIPIIILIYVTSKEPKFILEEKYSIPFSFLFLSLLRTVGGLIFVLFPTVAVTLAVYYPLIKIGIEIPTFSLLLVGYPAFGFFTSLFLRKSIHRLDIFNPAMVATIFTDWGLLPVKKYILMNIKCYRCGKEVKKVDYPFVRGIRPRSMLFFEVHCSGCKVKCYLGTTMFGKTLRWISKID